MFRRPTLRFLLSFTFLAAGVVGAQTPPSSVPAAPAEELKPCPPAQLNNAATPSIRCFRSDRGWIFSNDSAFANAAALALRAATTKFENAFGDRVEPGAIVQLPNGTQINDSTIRAAGARWVLPWSQGTAQSSHTRSISALQTVVHEAGHGWFRTWFAAHSSLARADSAYGTAGADWLDEVAALLMADSTGSEGGRSELKQLYSAGQLIPLETYLTMSHPLEGQFMTPLDDAVSQAFVKAALAAGYHSGQTGPVAVNLGDSSVIKSLATSGLDIAGTKDGSTSLSIKLKTTEATSMAAGAFYAQGRGFIDFLTERTGGLGVFGSIAKNEAKGSNITEWLRTTGAQYKLPTTVAELEKEWQHWLAAETQTPEP